MRATKGPWLGGETGPWKGRVQFPAVSWDKSLALSAAQCPVCTRGRGGAQTGRRLGPLFCAPRLGKQLA